MTCLQKQYFRSLLQKQKGLFLVLPPWPVKPRPKREAKKEEKKYFFQIYVPNIVWSLEAFHKLQSNSWICIENKNKIGNENSWASFLYKKISLHQERKFLYEVKICESDLKQTFTTYLSLSGSKYFSFLYEFCINYFNHHKYVIRYI